jgi:hypothetical protein
MLRMEWSLFVLKTKQRMHAIFLCKCTSLGQNVLSKEPAIPIFVLGALSKVVSTAKNYQFLFRTRQGNIQTVLVEKSSGSLNQAKDDEICFLSLTLIDRQDSVFGDIDWRLLGSAFELKLISRCWFLYYQKEVERKIY